MDIIDVVDNINAEPDTEQNTFLVTIEHNGKKIEREFIYAIDDEDMKSKVVMVSIIGDRIADSLEDMLEEITK